MIITHIMLNMIQGFDKNLNRYNHKRNNVMLRRTQLVYIIFKMIMILLLGSL